MPSSIDTTDQLRVAVLGAGRLGNALTRALRAAGVLVAGPYGRDDDPYAEIAYPDVVLLCVPDGELRAAAAGFEDDQLLAHCSGASGLDVLGDHPGFSLHPLTSITRAAPTGPRTNFHGVGAALDATGPEPLALAHALAAKLGMRPFHVRSEDRAAYHAAASIASNFLVTLEAAAERLAASAGVGHELLAPLVRASVENWAALGAEQALTGPVARGDYETVARQREAVAARTPELLELFDTLVAATDALAGNALEVST